MIANNHNTVHHEDTFEDDKNTTIHNDSTNEHHSRADESHYGNHEEVKRSDTKTTNPVKSIAGNSNTTIPVKPKVVSRESPIKVQPKSPQVNPRSAQYYAPNEKTPEKKPTGIFVKPVKPPVEQPKPQQVNKPNTQQARSTSNGPTPETHKRNEDHTFREAARNFGDNIKTTVNHLESDMKEALKDKKTKVKNKLLSWKNALKAGFAAGLAFLGIKVAADDKMENKDENDLLNPVDQNVSSASTADTADGKKNTPKVKATSTTKKNKEQ